VPTTIVDEETGEEKKRLVNRTRWKGFGPTAIYFADKDVPDKPSDVNEAQRAEADQKLLARLEEVSRRQSALLNMTNKAYVFLSQLFQERPIWTRTALFNQLSSSEVREVLK
jgi:general transcription factor 3C polypeptide 5 (transcription factor C subunit 1)